MENYKQKYLKYKKKYNNLKKINTITIKKMRGGSYKMELYESGNTEPISCSFKIPDLNYFKTCLLINLNKRGITEEQKNKYDIDYFSISNIEVKLAHQGNLIETNEYLEKLCQESCKVFYVLKKIDTINVNISPLTGASFTIKTRHTMNVKNLIENIKKSRNLNIEFDLTFSGNKLDKIKKLVDYNIQNNSTIVLIPKIESGFRSGHGRLNLPSGVYYIGPVSENVPHGLGTEYYRNRKIKYEGDFVYGVKEGHGKYIHSDGAYYIGSFINNVPHGLGKEYYSNNKLIYEGDFVDGKKHGKGTTYDNNGVLEYEGDFVDGVKEGKGIEYYEGTKKYEGDFVNGVKEGHGKYIYSDGAYYIGSFINNVPHGLGKEYFEGTTTYEGDFVDGRWHGKGINYFVEGDKFYEGDYVNGNREGEGIEYYDNGNTMYKGNFVDGLWHGKGIEYYEGNQIYEGYFVNGEREE